MSIRPHFNLITQALEDKAAGRAPGVLPSAVKPKAKRLAPFSIRLSEEERARLATEAGGAPLGTYIKSKVLGTPLPMRRSRFSIEDRKALAQLLGLLGKSHIAKSLADLSLLAANGALPLTPETDAHIRECLDAVKSMRSLLMQALGLRTEHAP